MDLRFTTQGLGCLMTVALATERDHKSKFYTEGAIPLLQGIVAASAINSTTSKAPINSTMSTDSDTATTLARMALQRLGAEIPVSPAEPTSASHGPYSATCILFKTNS